MKLDKEQVFSLGNAGTRTDSKPLEHNVNVLDSFDLKTRKEILKENEDSNICDLKGRQLDLDRLPNALKIEDVLLGTFSQSSKKLNAPNDNSNFYVDKSITERELPELVVYCKDSSYQVVRDICVDDGAYSKEKFLFDSCACKKRVSALPSLVNDAELEVVKENVDVDVPSIDVQKPFSEGRKEDYVDIADMLLSSEQKHLKNDSSSAGHRTENTVKLDVEFSHPNSSRTCTGDVKQQLLLKPIQDEVMAAACVCEESENDSRGEMLAGNNILVSVKLHASHTMASETQDSADEKSCHISGAVSTATESFNYEKKANFPSQAQYSGSELSINSTTDHNGMIEAQSINSNSERFESWNSSRREDAEGAKSFSSKLQHNSLGESSFSRTVSERIAYSGSLSVRSDSSTTSARSFAFPILQPEWNSSPVRMAKAGRGQKQKSWKCGLCCKF